GEHSHCGGCITHFSPATGGANCGPHLRRNLARTRRGEPQELGSGGRRGQHRIGCARFVCVCLFQFLDLTLSLESPGFQSPASLKSLTIRWAGVNRRWSVSSRSSAIVWAPEARAPSTP